MEIEKSRLNLLKFNKKILFILTVVQTWFANSKITYLNLFIEFKQKDAVSPNSDANLVL